MKLKSKVHTTKSPLVKYRHMKKLYTVGTVTTKYLYFSTFHHCKQLIVKKYPHCEVWNGENMENLTALYTSYLRFTFGTNVMHASSCSYRIFVFVLAFFYTFMLTEFWVKDALGTIDHAQIALASLGRAEAYTCRCSFNFQSHYLGV